MNLSAILQRTIDNQPADLALAGPGLLVTYRELSDLICRTADHLGALRLDPGSCVGLHVQSGLDYIVLTYAAWRCGLCVVPLPVELAAAEKQEICRSIAMHAVLTREDRVEVFDPFRAGTAVFMRPGISAIPTRPASDHPPGFSGLNGAFIRFSSGTTGLAKGVVLSHESVWERVCAANQGLGLGPGDTVIWLLSMAYHFAVSIVSYLSFGAKIVLSETHLGAEIVAAVERSRATIIYGSPLHYSWMGSEGSGRALPSLRLALCTTASLTRQVGETFVARFGLPLTQAYGIIEIGLPCINLAHAHDRWDSVGQVLPAYELRLEDVGLGDERREILFRGPGLLDAYYSPWQPRAEILRAGWFHTGDLGCLDADGCLYIRGRSKELINILGLKVFPQEVEAVLRSHPGVSEASAFGQNDDRLGEAVWACVVPRPEWARRLTERELVDHCTRHLAVFKVPRKIQLVTALPRTHSGKVLRRKVPLLQ